ncbi:MAG TPA: excinuclease ABC subunit UvrA [Bacteroidia bacterium]|jgi:excinuclease ABC subunit A|nr:excinuclease ABC subunit UvrA [Bacteroidia bacterium]
METIREHTLESLDTKKYIVIRGARVHNLKDVDVAIPRNRLVVITGLSGSGKSSLAFDTLFAEGQRRYVESLSSYARQFLGKIEKPAVTSIRGISPAVAIEQKVNTRNPRSTVGTSTEIYDYLKLLFARTGKTISPVSGRIVRRDTVSDVVEHISSYPSGTQLMLLAPLHKNTGKSLREQLELLMHQGFTRIIVKQEVERIDEFLDKKFSEKTAVLVVIDRIRVKPAEDGEDNRMADSVQTAFFEGEGECMVQVGDKPDHIRFSNRFELDDISFEEPSLHFFSFNNPIGACKHCEGFGTVIGIDEDLVIPDKSLSVYEDAVACWRGEKMSEWKEELVLNAHKFNFPVHKPWNELSQAQRELVWVGNKHFGGLHAFFKFIEEQSYKIQYRVMLSRYRGRTVCPECKGTRLRKDANYVKVSGYSITDIVLLQVRKALDVFSTIQLNAHDEQVARRILTEIISRLQFLCDVGLGYLTLNRLSNSLSGGESQRINLATSLGSSLVGSMYVLDEPSIGLHPRDTERLIHVLKSLRNLGNTVIVVEHDEEIMRAADEIIDIGPGAGTEGGNIVFQGNHTQLSTATESLTADYLCRKTSIAVPSKRRSWTRSVDIKGASENNLKNIDVSFPLKVMTVVTGVSGSGKTSLVKRVLYPALKKLHGGFGEQTGAFDKLGGDYRSIEAVEMVDQNPIGKSSRSNPVTYIKAYDEIRALWADQPLAKMRGYKPSQFSFNVDGGRCEVCEGEGEVLIEMQFMADVHLPCEVCNGKRFKQETLEVLYRQKSVADILNMTVADAIAFFSEEKTGSYERKIIHRLQPLADVGLGYVHLGQSSSTLSGGEAQRIKLASFIGQGSHGAPTLFIFDEPTTGLHFHDISKLLIAFDALLAQGHSIIIIEHNMEVIKCADWVIDLGPEGGDEGGRILFAGTPEDLVKCKESYTAGYLQEKL